MRKSNGPSTVPCGQVTNQSKHHPNCALKTDNQHYVEAHTNWIMSAAADVTATLLASQCSDLTLHSCRQYCTLRCKRVWQWRFKATAIADTGENWRQTRAPEQTDEETNFHGNYRRFSLSSVNIDRRLYYNNSLELKHQRILNIKWSVDGNANF